MEFFVCTCHVRLICLFIYVYPKFFCWGFSPPTWPKKHDISLTRRPCKGDEFEILIFEAKRQNAGICRSRQKMFATWTFISIGRRVTQE